MQQNNSQTSEKAQAEQQPARCATAPRPLARVIAGIVAGASLSTGASALAAPPTYSASDLDWNPDSFNNAINPHVISLRGALGGQAPLSITLPAGNVVSCSASGQETCPPAGSVTVTSVNDVCLSLNYSFPAEQAFPLDPGQFVLPDISISNAEGAITLSNLPLSETSGVPGVANSCAYTAPIAAPDSATVASSAGAGTESANLLPGLLTNDSGSNGNDDLVFFDIDSGPANGTLRLVGAARSGTTTGVFYTPAPGFTGTDQFTYTIINDVPNSPVSNAATVSLTVTNEAPNLDPGGDLDANGNLVIDEGASGTVNLVASDREGGLLTFGYQNVPSFCSTSDLSNGNATLTCTPGFSDEGSYRVSVQVSDNGVPVASDSLDIPITITDQVAPTINTTAGAIAVREDVGNASVVVERTGSDDGAVSVEYSISAGTATAGTDYTTVSGVLSWAAGNSAPQTVQIPITDDALFEPGADETLTLTLSNATGGAQIGSSSQTQVSIADNNQQPTVTLASALATATETDGTVTLTVSRGGDLPAAGAITVNFASADGTATAGADYTSVNGTLSWTGTDVSSRTITVPLTDDAIFEGATAETLTVTLSQPSANVLISPTAVSTVELADNDAQTTIGFAPPSYSGNETDPSVELIVTRSGASGGAVSVDYRSSNGTATAGEDYVATTGTLTWADGETGNRTVTVPLLNDDLFEPGAAEQFTVDLSSLSGNAVLADGQATVSVGDDEQPTALQFLAPEVTVSEDAGTLDIQVSRINASDGAVSVDFATANGSAIAGADYTAQTGTLTWASGDSTPKLIQLAIFEDAIFEAAEDLSLTLSNPSGTAVLGSPATLRVEIVEDDSAPTLAFALDALDVEESAGTATVTVSRSGATDQAVTVDYATADATATAGSDYSATSGTLSWAAGNTDAQQINVPIIDDVIFDGLANGTSSETLTVTLAAPTGPVQLGSTTTTTITINDDEQVPTLAPAAATVTVNESAGTAVIAIERTGATAGAVSVDFATSDNTASAGSDYTATSGTLSWADGEGGTKAANVPIFADTEFETATNESFVVTLSNASAGIALPSSEINVEIADDDTAPLISFESTALQVTENDTVVLTVTRAGTSSAPSSIDYATVAGTAVAGTDFVATSGTLTWAAGDSASQTITVPITNDSLFENPIEESFTVVLSNAVGAAPGAAVEATVTIADDDREDADGSGIAGQDQIVPVDPVSAQGTFQLAAIRSSQYQSYEWFLNGEPVAQSATLTQSLPPGDYEYELRVFTVANLQLSDRVQISVTRAMVQTADRLEDIAGLTETQRAVARNLDNICSRLNTRTSLADNEEDLRERCTQIILNEDTSEQAAALTALSGRQITGQMTNVLEIGSLQFRNISERMRTRRDGEQPNGLSGLNVQVQGQSLPTEALSSLVEALTGGNAGEESPFGRLAFFLSGDLSFGEQDETDRETGFEFETRGLTAGFDYRLTDRLFAGIAIGYGSADTDFNERQGALDSAIWTASAFASYATDRVYVDGLLAYGLSEHDTERNIRYEDALGSVDRTANGSTDGDQWSVGFEAGLNLNQGKWAFNPNVSSYYTEAAIDGFGETGARGLNLGYGNQSNESLTVSGGLAVSYTLTTKYMVLIPQLRLDYVLELENDGQIINARFLNDPFADDFTNPSPAILLRTDDPDDSYATIGLGLSAQFTNGFAGFVDWQTVAAHEDLSIDSLSFGLRWERLF